MRYFVVVGPLLSVRVWAQARGIPALEVIAVTRPFDAHRLLGLAGGDIVVVRLAEPIALDLYAEQALARLTAMGAAQHGPDWWPPGYAPETPAVDLRGERPPAPRRPATL